MASDGKTKEHAMTNPFQLNSTGKNENLPDVLASLRARIKELKAEEKETIEKIKEVGNCVGATHEAIVDTTNRRTLDTSAVKEKYGDELEPFYKDSEVVSVKVKEL